jgi:TolA-binding protein
MNQTLFRSTVLCLVSVVVASTTLAQPAVAPRSSIVEDRAAKKLVEAGDSRLEANEPRKAVEVWQSVVERYPRSKVRFTAHMRLGVYFLERDRAYDKARVQFESVTDEENKDEDQRAEATLKMGICFYEARNYGKCFGVMRDVIEKFPVSTHINQAYYYIGLGHFQLGHYSRAISAFEKVGTSLGDEDDRVQKVEAGKRLFVKIEDADLAALEPGRPVTVECRATSGDVEKMKCFPIGRNVRIVLGSLVTRLGVPRPGNGTLEVKGDDKVEVVYIDEHTADKEFNRKRLHDVTVVGDGVVSITDGAFSETLQGVVLGKSINIQTQDADRDTTDAADKISAIVELHRLKTDEEIELETAKLIESGDIELEEGETPKVDRYKKIDQVSVTLAEVLIETMRSVDGVLADPIGVEPTDDKKPADETKAAADKKAAQDEPEDSAASAVDKAIAKAGKTPAKAKPAAAPPKTTAEPVEDNSIHSGVFRTTVPLAKADEIIQGDAILQALPGDLVRIVYEDKNNTTPEPILAKAEAKCIEGNLGGVRVTRTQISDRELRVKTKLKTAHALTNIGNRYKEFGLKKNADGKYQQALVLCEEIMIEARRLGGRLLEETYVQLWKIYFEMDKLELAAAMAQRLQREFPNSGFVDDALLQLADVARKQGSLNRAIGIYNRLVRMETSQLRGEAQFGIAECYDTMAEAVAGAASDQLYDRAFQEYKKVFDQFPESGRVGEAVARMAAHYYRQKDYARAIDTFETVLSNHPDAKFLDVILFNYGRCLYRMKRMKEARQRFDQLIGDYPESALAGDARKISEALVKGGF